MGSHLLTDAQKAMRVKIAKHLLKTYKNCDESFLTLLQVMKLGYISLNPKERLIIKYGLKRMEEDL